MRFSMVGSMHSEFKSTRHFLFFYRAVFLFVVGPISCPFKSRSFVMAISLLSLTSDLQSLFCGQIIWAQRCSAEFIQFIKQTQRIDEFSASDCCLLAADGVTLLNRLNDRLSKGISCI